MIPLSLSSIAQVVPLTHVVRAIQEPWLDLGNPTSHLAVLAALAAAATAVWLTQGTRAEGSHTTRQLRRTRRVA